MRAVYSTSPPFVLTSCTRACCEIELLPAERVGLDQDREQVGEGVVHVGGVLTISIRSLTVSPSEVDSVDPDRPTPGTRATRGTTGRPVSTRLLRSSPSVSRSVSLPFASTAATNSLTRMRCRRRERSEDVAVVETGSKRAASDRRCVAGTDEDRIGLGDVGERDVRERRVGERHVRERDVGEREPSEVDVGERDIGERRVCKRRVGERHVCKRSVGKRNVGQWNVGERNVRERHVGERNARDSGVRERDVGERRVAERRVGERNVRERNIRQRRVGTAACRQAVRRGARSR